jgi:putative membrane protein
MEKAMRLLTITLVATLASPAAAQFGNPAGIAPGTRESAPGTPQPHETNNQDRLFTRLLAAGGMAEVQLGKLAGQQAQSRAVKDFAQQMVQDHTKANDELTTLAKAANIPLPTEPNPEHKAARSQLEKLRGKQFDIAYMQTQVQDHQKTTQLLEWIINSGQDGQIRSFAVALLPIVLHHLDLAQNVMTELTGQTPREIAATRDISPPPGNRR